MSRVLAIAIRDGTRAPMRLLEHAAVSVAGGIDGDFRGAQRGRQVTLLSESAWRAACAEVGAELPWTTRRANLLVDGVEFDDAWLNRRIRIGGVELVVTEETEPCARMNEQCAGLTAALTPQWRGGICCNVVSGGDIRVGDTLECV